MYSGRIEPRRSTGKTPFSMTYEAEAVILLETGSQRQEPVHSIQRIKMSN